MTVLPATIPFTWLECSRCRTWLPATDEYFGERALAGNTLYCVCRACTAAVGAASATKAGQRGTRQHPQGSGDAERTCSRCRQSWPLERAFFSPVSGKPGQLQLVCRACESEARARRRGLPSAQPVRHVSDGIAPLLNGAYFFQGAMR